MPRAPGQLHTKCHRQTCSSIPSILTGSVQGLHSLTLTLPHRCPQDARLGQRLGPAWFHFNMDDAAGSNGNNSELLLPELRLRILALLPPNILALSGRLACKDAAQRFSEPHHLTVRLDQPLPGHVTADATSLDSASAALRELAFCQKLQLLRTAAASGCEANIDFTWQLVQPHVFPELLHTDHYRQIAEGKHRSSGMVPHHTPAADVATPAVEAGHLHLLPSLAQRFPGLVDAGATLEAVARLHDLAALQRAWEVLGPQVRARAAKEEQRGPIRVDGWMFPADCWKHTALGVWRRMMVAAAGSPTADAITKMEWVLDMGRAHGNVHFPVEHADVCGVAAASGDMARLQWLHDRGFPWGTEEVLAVVMQHAELSFVHQLEQEGGYLPPADDEVWRSSALLAAAARASCDSAAKLRWLVECRGADLGTLTSAVQAAASSGNLEALQLLLFELHTLSPLLSPAAAGEEPSPVRQAVTPWLEGEGREEQGRLFWKAACNGDLATVRWLLQAGCSQAGGFRCVGDAIDCWPSDTPKDGERLVEAVRLLVEAGVPLLGPEGQDLEDLDDDQDSLHPLDMAITRYHPWFVLRALMDMLQAQDILDYHWWYAISWQGRTGCEAALEALVEMGVHEQCPDGWYSAPAWNGDRGTLACLQRLGLPLDEEVAYYGMPLPALKWLVEHGGALSEGKIWKMLDELVEIRGLWHNSSQAPYEQETEAWLREQLEGEVAER